MTVERQTKEIRRRRLWWEMPVEEERGQPWKQVGAAELRIGDGVISIVSLPTLQHRQLNNREPGPSNACCPELQSRTPPRVLL